MRANSLALRLFIWATGWTVVILIITGVALSTLYRHAVERAFDRRLDVYLRTLVADVASPEEGADKYPQSIGEPLFELPLSGWYWQVTRLDTKTPEVHSSRSLWDSSLPRLPDEKSSTDAEFRQGYAKGPEDQELRLVERDIDLGTDGRYLIAVAGDASEIDDETGSFERTIIITFTAWTLALLLTTAWQVRFGLAPLARISEGLAAIRSGRAERLQGKFPVEIAPLARETNALIDANREIVERARTHVGNLAHALKTPLSVIVNEAAARGNDPLAYKVLEQTDIMRDQVARQLERARLAARSTVVGTSVEVPPVVTALARTMEKLYRSRDIAIAVDVPEHALFRGEQQDLEEMIGNLVDNGCKWAQSRVAIEVVADPSNADQTKGGKSQRAETEENRETPRVRIIVDDDGPGLSPAEREQVALRGQRLDETKPGSGLGLSIVVELAGLYGGVLTLGNKLGMFDQDGRMRDNAGDQNLAVRQLDVLPDLPFVLMARIGRLEGIGAGADLQNDIDDVFELHVVDARAHIDAVAGVKTDLLRRNVAQRVIERCDADFRPFAAVGDARLGMDDVIGDQPWIVDLQQKSGSDDSLVFLAHRLGDGEDVFLLRLVEDIFLPILNVGWRNGWHEHFFGVDAIQSRLEIVDVAFELEVAFIADRAGADHVSVRRGRVGLRIKFGKR